MGVNRGGGTGVGGDDFIGDLRVTIGAWEWSAVAF